MKHAQRRARVRKPAGSCRQDRNEERKHTRSEGTGRGQGHRGVTSAAAVRVTDRACGATQQHLHHQRTRDAKTTNARQHVRVCNTVSRRLRAASHKVPRQDTRKSAQRCGLHFHRQCLAACSFAFHSPSDKVRQARPRKCTGQCWRRFTIRRRTGRSNHVVFRPTLSCRRSACCAQAKRAQFKNFAKCEGRPRRAATRGGSDCRT